MAYQYNEAQQKYILGLGDKFPNQTKSKEEEEKRQELVKQVNLLRDEGDEAEREWKAIFHWQFRHKNKPPKIKRGDVTENPPEVEAEMEEATRRLREWMAQPRKDIRKSIF